MDGATLTGADGGGGTTTGAAGRSTTAGGVAQPATSSAAVMDSAAPRRADNEANEAMGWVLLKAGVALLLGIFIVWWLMRGKK